ncbi:MAG: cytochrome C oxidase Cbb3 [Deltaproteobacteria bacterium]|nr:cytochrome C oxidase Cbb3 [Deltaproteobacteria bacterium]
MARFECNRCHDGTGLPDETEERHCVHCHQSIRAGTFDAPARELQRWRANLHSLNDAPSLAGLEGKLRVEWLAEFLVSPHDVRPGLPATMPRLPLSPDEARDIAAALAGSGSAEGDASAIGDPGEGLALLVRHSCLSCHAFSGAGVRRPALAEGPAVALAPDLRHTRQRMTRSMLLRWLEAPAELRPGTLMPTVEMSREDREHLADAILGAALAPMDATPVPDRLPVLDRPVGFDEVADRVLSPTCWHCHADADFAAGEAGAGNTGGFGFEARGVNLLDYTGVSSGYIADDGERRSLFASDAGVPHLVRLLMARHHEVRGHAVPGLTGMPLGLPPIPIEDIQLVETWIAQGRPN